ncbi:MAG: hydroxysqualene dehydroxylase HpnE [Alphaproteobacteria bacterium]|nr:hydroxysqualene dehydroxylase HpnE [Alphaproteobacteria bacterium]
MSQVHIIGAGLAGLSAAVALAGQGRAVTLYEAGPAAGGRCRSYFDRELGCRIDNGNHLVLSGNRAAMGFLDTIGARHLLGGPGRAILPFLDVTTGERWTVEPDPGPIPWWVFRRNARVPGTKLTEYGQLLRLRAAGAETTVSQSLDPRSALYRRLLAPLAIAALNTPPDAALARLLASVVRETLMQGGRASIPLYPRVGLSETFIDPAIAWLTARGATLHTGRRVSALHLVGGGIAGFDTTEGRVTLGAGDAVVLAVPPWVARDLLPWLGTPDSFEAIVNLHYRVDVAPAGEVGEAGFLGLIGGIAEWIFIKPGIVSITISAANRLVDRGADDLATAIWPEVCAALGLDGPMPPVRVVKERRATFAATAAQARLRPASRTPIGNLALAGDWTDTGLPATIEGAIRSGRAAAEALAA